MRNLIISIFSLAMFIFVQQSLLAQEVIINWLDKEVPEHFSGATFGVPWKKGLLKPQQTLQLTTDKNEALAAQTWPIAYWPDGSVKWTAVALAASDKLTSSLKLSVTEELQNLNTVSVSVSENTITVNTGNMTAVLNKEDANIIKSINKNGRLFANNGHLVLLHQNTPEYSYDFPLITTAFKGKIESVKIEQAGPVRAVIKFEGTHKSINNKTLLPFIVRLYFYAGSDNIRVMHTIIYDGDEEQDFISGIGLRFNVAMHDSELHDRHIRFTEENGGIFAESVKGLTGLRRDPGQEIIKAQLMGEKTPSTDLFPLRVKKGLPYIPSFGDYTLFQSSPNSFQIRKRTRQGYTWLNSAQGVRSNGVSYVGSPMGGMAFGIRNFWQSYPAQIDIRNAAESEAEVTLWLWAPEAKAMDLRFYHDGLSMDDYEKQWEGLEITYEDYEPGFGRPTGVARTSELNLWALNSTPSREELISYSEMVSNPPMLIADLYHLKEAGVFGNLWTVQNINEEHPVKAQINKRLNWFFNYYQQQIQDHNWYGFWDYGDIMHTYDYDRHVWRYDVGGYAWDNSELASDIWLWYYFLHSGRPEAFRMAEAMTRHTGEVDVHHLGPFAPLGSRHNVLHWGCSAKQLRISTAANRRFYYFLTADERIGDLMNEQLNAHKSLYNIPPLRKRADVDVSDSTMVELSFGTDWGSIASAWLSDWERSGSKTSYNRLVNSMTSIAKQPKGFFTGMGRMDVESGAFEISENQEISVSHLNAVFGLIEICTELIDLIDLPEFKKAWIQYCEFYNASPELQKKELGSVSRNQGLRQGHSRLTAYAAMKKDSEELSQRAWNEFTLNDQQRSLAIPETIIIKRPQTLQEVTEAKGISTNYAAQWCLAAMQIMSLIKEIP